MSFRTTAAACQMVMNVRATVVATTTLVVCEAGEAAAGGPEEVTGGFIWLPTARSGRHGAESAPESVPTGKTRQAASAVCACRRSLRNPVAALRGWSRSDRGKDKFPRLYPHRNPSRSIRPAAG